MITIAKRARLEPVFLEYLTRRNYPVDVIPMIVDFMLPLTQLTSIERGVIRDEDIDNLFLLTEEEGS